MPSARCTGFDHNQNQTNLNRTPDDSWLSLELTLISQYILSGVPGFVCGIVEEVFINDGCACLGLFGYDCYLGLCLCLKTYFCYNYKDKVLLFSSPLIYYY